MEAQRVLADRLGGVPLDQLFHVAPELEGLSGDRTGEEHVVLDLELPDPGIKAPDLGLEFRRQRVGHDTTLYNRIRRGTQICPGEYKFRPGRTQFWRAGGAFRRLQRVSEDTAVRTLPAVGRLLEDPALAPLISRLGRGLVTSLLREEIEKAREELLSGKGRGDAPGAEELAKAVEAQAS